jgi:hypothetical protein
MEWIDINDQTPICYEEGEWDGLRSDFVLVYTVNKLREEGYQVARMYEGTMDGSKFQAFYCINDYEVLHIVKWCEIKSAI